MKRLFLRLFGQPHWPTVLITYAIGTAGGLAAKMLGFPLPMLLGSLLAVGAASLFAFRTFGHLPQAPLGIRACFIPIIGVAIGGAARPDILAEIAAWLPSLVIVTFYIPLLHFLSYRLMLRTGRLDRKTAFYGTAPGGLIEMVQMGEEAGADVQMLVMLQFLRLVLTMIIVPVAFMLIEGHAVGSAGGAQMEGAPIHPRDVAILLVCGVAGAVIGARLRLPAGLVLGPILLSVAAHLAGLTATVPPAGLVQTAQVVIGTSLGVRFVGMPKRRVLHALGLALLCATVTIGGAAVMAGAISGLVGESARAVFLAFAPGGLVEMGLIALSLNLSILYVTAHHLLRIILSVSFARAFGSRIE